MRGGNFHFKERKKGPNFYTKNVHFWYTQNRWSSRRVIRNHGAKSGRRRSTVKGYDVLRRCLTVKFHPFATTFFFISHQCLFPMFCGGCGAFPLFLKFPTPLTSIPSLQSIFPLIRSALRSFVVHDSHSILLNCPFPPFVAVSPSFMDHRNASRSLMTAFSAILAHVIPFFAFAYIRAPLLWNDMCHKERRGIIKDRIIVI